MPAIDIDRDAAHQAAQHELAKPVYPKGSPTQQFHEWFRELLYRLAEKGSSTPGGWLALTVLLTVLVGAVVIAIRVARRTMHTRSSMDHQLFDTGELSADQHRATAKDFADESNWTAAIRHRLRAVARELEETRVLKPAPGCTANELARDAGACIPHLASELSRAATTFNDVTYGEQPGTPAGYQMIVDLDDRLRRRSAVGSAELSQTAAVDPWAPVQ
jgi:hypothetical protein